MIWKPVVSRMRRELFVNTRARLLPPDPREWKVHHVSVWADSLFTGELDDSYTTGIKTAVGRDGDLHRDEAQMENESDSVFDAGAKLRVHLVNGRALLEVEDIFEKVGVQRVGQLFALKTARSALMLQIGIESSSNGHSVGQHGSELEEYGHKDGGSGGEGKEEEEEEEEETGSKIAKSVINAAGLTVTNALVRAATGTHAHVKPNQEDTPIESKALTAGEAVHQTGEVVVKIFSDSYDFS